MLGSAFLKNDARGKLKNCYKAALVCALIYIIPTYLNAFLTSHINVGLQMGMILSYTIDILVTIFVVEIFKVGFYKFLMELKPTEENNINDYNYNLLFFGYKKNFGNVLKITFLRNLKLVLWGVIMVLPTLALGFLAMKFLPTDFLKTVQGLSNEVMANMSDANVDKLSEYVNSVVPHYNLLTFLYLVLSIAAAVPFIRKNYEYAMIPMILAENPEIRSKKAFKRTKDIMVNYRMRFFFVQLSFLFYNFAAIAVLYISGSIAIYCFIEAVIMPYICMTYLEFYRQRNKVIENNIATYGEQE